MFAQTTEEAFVVTDTLATTPDGDPYLFVDKCLPVPSMNLIVATTGYGELLVRWLEVIRSRMRARDITMLDLHTPAALREIWADLEAEYGAMPGTGTIYHFGLVEETGRCERFTYRSSNNFQSERTVNEGFAVKPPPTSGAFEVPAELSEWIDLAYRVRGEQDELPLGERVFIGGDLTLTHLSRDGIRIARIHRFPDQMDDWQMMNEDEPEAL